MDTASLASTMDTTTGPSLEEYSYLLNTLYASLNADQGFDLFLQAFINQFDGISATLMAVSPSPRKILYGWTVGIPKQYERWYIESGMAAKDTTLDLFETASQLTEGFISSSQQLNGTTLIDSVIDDFKPWLQEKAIVDAAGLIIPFSADEHLILILHRDQNTGVFHPSDITQLNLLVPHIVQAIQLFTNLYRKKHQNNSLQATLDTLTQATLVIDEFMEVSHRNDHADKLIARCNDISIREGKLTLSCQTLQHQFTYSVWEMLRSAIAEKSRDSLVIHCNNNPMTLSFAPITYKDGNKHNKGILLQVFDPSEPVLPDAERIKAVFRLSKAEALLCEYLLQGCTLKDISEKRNVSINTVREQMRNVFNKTGYKRQSELIAAILRAVP